MALKAKGKPQADSWPQQLTQGKDSGSTFIILLKPAASPHSPPNDTRMDSLAAAPSSRGGLFEPVVLPSNPEADTTEITKPILEAIDASKAALMVRIDHLASEWTLIRHDLDKIRTDCRLQRLHF